MIQITVKEGQTLVDIVVQHLGDLTRLFEVAELNNISITEILNIGQLLNLPDVDVSKKRMVEYFAKRKIVPASMEIQTGTGGIGHMTIEGDENPFIIA